MKERLTSTASDIVGITKMNNPDWKLLFYILGGITMGWSIVLGVVLPDNPSNAWFLSKEERVLGVKRIAQNEVGIKTKVSCKPCLLPLHFTDAMDRI